MFIDEAKIRIKAGDDGNGCMAFRREKFVPRGGPSGGDGGRGGDIIMVSSQRHNTLIHFRYNPEHKAQRGEHGLGSNCHGLDGRSIVLKVPVGTSVFDMETGELVHDFQYPDEQVIIAKGGRGGRGNQHFATPVHQAPREHEAGRAGEELEFEAVEALFAGAAELVLAGGLVGAGGEVLVAAAATAALGDDDFFIGVLEVVDQFAGFLVVEGGADGDLDGDGATIEAGTVGTHAVLPALGFVLRVVAEMDEGVVALGADHDDVAAASAVAAGGTAAGDEFFAAEGHAAVAAVAGFYFDFCFIDKHGTTRDEGLRNRE